MDKEQIHVQDSLKREYSEDEYNQIIERLKLSAGYDMELLASMSVDRMLSHQDRLFAYAAMSKQW